MPRGGRTLVPWWAAVCTGFLWCRAGYAADLPGVRLDVVRDPRAVSCADAQRLADHLRERLGPAPLAEQAPVVLEVEIRSTRQDFAATVRASGGKRGIRTLNAPGPSCAALEEALLVSLLVLLDRDPERPERVHDAAAPTTRPVSLWLGAGVALTRSLPAGSSAALFGEMGARYRSHSLWAGALWTPEHDVPFYPGFVIVSALGGQLRACTAPLGLETIRLDGCVLGLLLSLRGGAHEFTNDSSQRRPWWLVGAGVELGFEPVPWFSTAVAGRLLFSPHRESFSIEGLEDQGSAYETARVIGWLGLSLSAKIW